jgi:hypothetical protein
MGKLHKLVILNLMIKKLSIKIHLEIKDLYVVILEHIYRIYIFK